MGALHDAQLRACIVDCLECYSVCREQAARSIADPGGPCTPEDLALLDECAALCRTSADFMLAGFRSQGELCAACARVCEQAARAFAGRAELEACEQACRGCARSCGLTSSA